MATEPVTTLPILVLGRGNTIMGDDAAGILAARSIGEKLQRTDIEIAESSAGAISLIFTLENRKRIFIIDAVRTSPCIPGRVHRLELSDLESSETELSAHSTNLYTAVQMARRYGSQIPDDIVLYLVEVEACEEVSESCSEIVLEAVDEVSRAVVEEIVQ